MKAETAAPVIVFDGVCLLCSRWVRFLLKHDRAARYHFAAMQSEHGRALLLAHGLDPDSPLSFLLVEDHRGYTDTRAIDNFIVRLRRYIEDDPTRPRHLLTVRGVGYRFIATPETKE